ncbi:hypothetical protein TNCV_1567341, partial [Trichonephila clavipes]
RGLKLPAPVGCERIAGVPKRDNPRGKEGPQPQSQQLCL